MTDFEYLMVEAVTAGEMTMLVAELHKEGWDLFLNTAAGEHKIFQWLARHERWRAIRNRVVEYEYKMLEAVTAGEMTRQVAELQREGWDLYLSTVAGPKVVYQWMARPKEKPLRWGVEEVAGTDVESPYIRTIPMVVDSQPVVVIPVVGRGSVSSILE